MVQDLKYKNKPSQETLYGWFPGGQEPSRHDPKDIYIKLGSRPPREQSYYEADILYQYHQSLVPSQRDYPSKQSVTDSLKPPWSLHVQTAPNRSDYDEDQKANLNRAKSAPTHRIILKIPLPNVSNNIFESVNDSITADERSNLTNTESEIHLTKDDSKTSLSQQQQRPKTSFNAPFSPAPSVTPDRFMLMRSNLADSRNSFNDHNKQTKLIETKPLNQNELKDVKNSTQETNSYTNLMSDLIDSKYLESLTTKSKFNTEITTNNDSLEATATRLGLAKSAAPIRRNLIHKVIEVKNIGKKPIVIEAFDQQMVNSLPIANKFRPSKSRPKTTLIQTKPSETTNNNNNVNNINTKSNKTLRQRAGTAPLNVENRNKPPIFTYQTTATPNNKIDSNYTLSDYHRELLLLSQDKKPITGTTSQLTLAEKLNKPVATTLPLETEVLHTNLTSFDDVKLVEGHWKDQLINRGSYLQKRPKYNIKIEPEKLKIDPAPPEIHHNASETYFYNTVPFRKATFTINPNFISENLNVKKLDLQNRLGSSNGNAFGPVKFRRDYAFVY